MAIWLVEHPISQYEQDVKALAKEQGFKIVDARFADDIDKELLAGKTPELTKVGEQPKKAKPKRGRPKKAD